MTNTMKVAEWTEHPFTSYDRRGWQYRHRVIIEHYQGAGVDVRHDRRLEKGGYEKDQWETLTVYEAREHGIQELSRHD